MRWLLIGRRAAQRLGPQSGRTLLELMVAMAIASIVTLALASIVILGLRFSRTSQYEDQRVYPVRNAFDTVTRDLRVAIAYNENCNGMFAVSRRLPTGGSGIVAFEYVPGTGQLHRRIFSTADCTGTPTSSQTIAYQITRFEITVTSSERFRVEMAAESNDPDSTEFSLRQDVTRRVMMAP